MRGLQPSAAMLGCRAARNFNSTPPVVAGTSTKLDRGSSIGIFTGFHSTNPACWRTSTPNSRNAVSTSLPNFNSTPPDAGEFDACNPACNKITGMFQFHPALMRGLNQELVTPLLAGRLDFNSTPLMRGISTTSVEKCSTQNSHFNSTPPYAGDSDYDHQANLRLERDTSIPPRVTRGVQLSRTSR